MVLAKCEVAYEGRATSTLESGNYLIVIKSDGSILIHGNNLLKPKNYMGPKARIVVGDDSIVATKKKETITGFLAHGLAMGGLGARVAMI